MMQRGFRFAANIYFREPAFFWEWNTYAQKNAGNKMIVNTYTRVDVSQFRQT